MQATTVAGAESESEPEPEPEPQPWCGKKVSTNMKHGNKYCAGIKRLDYFTCNGKNRNRQGRQLDRH